MKNLFRTLIALIAILLEFLARLIERRLVPWAAHR